MADEFEDQDDIFGGEEELEEFYCVKCGLSMGRMTYREYDRLDKICYRHVFPEDDD